MTLKTMKVILAVVGFVTVFAGLIIGLQNSGACPANQPGCDHTFPGTNIWIGTTANIVGVLGLVLLAAAAVIVMYTRIAKTSAKTR